METKELIKAKQVEIREIEENLSILRHELTKLTEQYETEKTGLKAGDIVVNGNGQKGVLTCFERFWYWKKIKKDGTLYENEQYAWNVKKIEQ